jgi:hypothetical protein
LKFAIEEIQSDLEVFREKKLTTKKVVVHLSGGLGNQLFQFLKASQIARDNSSEIWLNLNWFENPKYRKFGYKANLNKRKPEILKFEKARNCKVEQSRLPRDGRFERLLNFVPVKILKVFGLVSDKQIHWSESGINQRKLRVIGYHVSNSLPEDWDISLLLGEITATAANHRYESIGVHVRLGDYLEQKFIVVPTEKYYLSALAEAEKIIPNSKVFIFTDNPIQLHEKFPELSEKADKVVCTEDPISDLLELSRNKVIIASNSTYSWWSTQFNRDSLLVIHPAYYFTDSSRDEFEAPNWPKSALAIDPILGKP